MAKKSLAAFLLFVLSLNLLSASNDSNEVGMPSTEEVTQTLTVIMDCLSASIVSSCCASEPFALPSCTVSIDQESGLPVRIAFLLADPADFVEAMSPLVVSGNTSFFSAIFTSLSKVASDPLISACYFIMASRQYMIGDYAVSGAVNFVYPEGTTFDVLENLWATRSYVEGSIGLNLEFSIYGAGMHRPMYIKGDFEMSLSQNGEILVTPVQTYVINDALYQGGSFRF